MKIKILIASLVLFLISCETRPPQVPQNPDQEKASALKEKSSEIILDHKYFKVSYNPQYRLPNWVSYHLYEKNLRIKIAKRKNKFFADPKLKTLGAPFLMPNSFGHGYDRGHMAPSDDFIWNQKANDETFVMSNMSPQTVKLNRGVWKYLEEKVRKWACTEGELEIYSGPIFDKELTKLPSGISIPKRFFKVVLDETPPKKAVGFIFYQNDTKKDYTKRAISVEDVERITGYRFFPDLNKGDEEMGIKDKFNLTQWKETNCIPKK